jgi:hypothetical protein
VVVTSDDTRADRLADRYLEFLRCVSNVTTTMEVGDWPYLVGQERALPVAVDGLVSAARATGEVGDPPGETVTGRVLLSGKPFEAIHRLHPRPRNGR